MTWRGDSIAEVHHHFQELAADPDFASLNMTLMRYPVAGGIGGYQIIVDVDGQSLDTITALEKFARTRNLAATLHGATVEIRDPNA